MGQPKISLQMGDGSTFAAFIAKQYYDFGCQNIILVVNEDGADFLAGRPMKTACIPRVVVNRYPERGRFSSIKTGLDAIAGHRFVFIHNVDNPFARAEVLVLLYENRYKADLIKPVFGGKGGHPVLISPKIVRDILDTDPGEISLKNFLEKYSTFLVESADNSILVNINTPNDLENLIFGGKRIE